MWVPLQDWSRRRPAGCDGRLGSCRRLNGVCCTQHNRKAGFPPFFAVPCSLPCRASDVTCRKEPARRESLNGLEPSPPRQVAPTNSFVGAPRRAPPAPTGGCDDHVPRRRQGPGPGGAASRAMIRLSSACAACGSFPTFAQYVARRSSGAAPARRLCNCAARCHGRPCLGLPGLPVRRSAVAGGPAVCAAASTRPDLCDPAQKL